MSEKPFIRRKTARSEQISLPAEDLNEQVNATIPITERLKEVNAYVSGALKVSLE